MDLETGDPLLLVAAGAAGLFAVAALMRVTGRRGGGFFQYFPYAILASLAVLIAVSGRSLLSDYGAQIEFLQQRNPVANWANHLATLFLVLVSVDRIGNYFLRSDGAAAAPYSLATAFVLFWIATVASPAFLGAYGSFAKEGLYALLIGCAALVLSPTESEAAVAAARTSLLLFLGAGVALIPLRPELVMDSAYTAGLLHGLPRFAGLAPHAVALGMLSQLFLLCVYSRPFSRRWLNLLSWGLGIFCLILAQSKTTWISFPICAACIFFMSGGSEKFRGLGDPRRLAGFRLVPIGVALAVVALGVAYMAGGLDQRISAFFAGQRGTDLTSLSGRSDVWSAALEDWARHPVFGYGNHLFDDAYRLEIKMPFAVNGHDQFVDTLARSGLVGAAGLALYMASLFAFAVRFATGSRGLSLAILVAITIGCISEVPLALHNYGPDVLQQALLLAVLAGEARKGVAPDAMRTLYGHQRRGAGGWWPIHLEHEGRAPRIARR